MAALADSWLVAYARICWATARAAGLTEVKDAPLLSVQALGTATSPKPVTPPPPAVPSKTTALVHGKCRNPSAVVAEVSLGAGPAMAMTTRRPISDPA